MMSAAVYGLFTSAVFVKTAGDLFIQTLQHNTNSSFIYVDK